MALIATSPDSTEVALITWGRIHDSVDPRPLIAEVRRHHTLFAFDFAASIELCHSLSDVADFDYFFEALWAFGRFPPSTRHTAWKREKRAAIRLGEDIYKLGRRRSDDAAAARHSPGSIAHGFSYAVPSEEVTFGMLEGDLQSLIDGATGRALLRLPHVTGFAKDPFLDGEDRPTGRHALLIRTDVPDEQRDALDESIIEVFRHVLPRPEPDLLWSFIGEDAYRALNTQA